MELGECKLCGVVVVDKNLTTRQLEMFEVTGMCSDCSRKMNKPIKMQDFELFESKN